MPVSSPSRDANPRVVVTGGRGFIGAALIRRLTGAGYPALPFDLRDGHDICDERALFAVIEPGDTVVHLAAYADLYEARERPVEATRINVLGTACVADVVRRRQGRLVLASTLCVYGNQNTYPTPECAVPNPSEIYAQTKLAAEQVVLGMVASFGLDAAIVRFPGVYGPGMRDALAVARFMHAAGERSELLVHGDGLQTRSPMHVDDVADGLATVVRHAGFRGAVNLAAPEEISALDLARRIIALAGGGTIRHIPQRTPQTLRELADGTRAARELGWSPRISLAEGLRSTWRWWQAQRQAYEPRDP